MADISYDDLMASVKGYINDEKQIQLISDAYLCALKVHKGQKRESGEEYIIHPIAVAFILSQIHADADTIVAGLLHDVIEDTSLIKEDIAEVFNETVANLVDGVSKISKMNFSSQEEAKASNTRKIVESITTDVRVILIKLADRLHNMRTLQYKTEFKQKENASETMEIYVPLAYYLGAFRIKNELEDLSLRYLKPEVYLDIHQKLETIKKERQLAVEEMLADISDILNDNEISHEIKMRIKNVYGVYKAQIAGKKIENIHDLSTLKIKVGDIPNCYLTLMHVHSKYPPINKELKDYIALPKTNMYQSLHTTVFGKRNKIVQVQIKTHEMDLIAEYGLAAYWQLHQNNDSISMQKKLEKFPFYKSLSELNGRAIANQEFINRLRDELFAKKIYVHTPKGKPIELVEGSTPVDFAYKIHSDIGDDIFRVIVNGDYVAPDYILQKRDRVEIEVRGDFIGPILDWHGNAHTPVAKKRIKEYRNKKYSGDKE